MIYLIALSRNHYQVIPKHFLDTTSNQLNKALCYPASYCMCISVNQVRIMQLSGICVLIRKDNAFHFPFYPASCYCFSDFFVLLLLLFLYFPTYFGLSPQFYSPFLLSFFLYLLVSSFKILNFHDNLFLMVKIRTQS